MWEFQIENIKTGDLDVIFGYSWSDALKREGLDPKEWACIRRDYID